MRIETHPFNYQIEKNFPFRQRLASFEGGDVWLAENDDFYYIIVDEGTMADFLIPDEDDDLLNELVKIYEFDSESDRQRYIQDRGWGTYQHDCR